MRTYLTAERRARDRSLARRVPCEGKGPHGDNGLTNKSDRVNRAQSRKFVEDVLDQPSVARREDFALRGDSKLHLRDDPELDLDARSDAEFHR